MYDLQINELTNCTMLTVKNVVNICTTMTNLVIRY